MSNFESIRILGMDESRPPLMRKESYIDLYFKLSHKVPVDWSDEFNSLGRQSKLSPKMDRGRDDCIASYVNEMSQIPAQVESIKRIIVECNKKYLEKIRQKEEALAIIKAKQTGQNTDQLKLNAIIAALVFDPEN